MNSRDVNKIFGWSIYHLRKQKIRKMASQDLPQPTRHMLKKELDFLETMIFHKEDALLDETYMAKSYDVFMRSFDRGGLTLVNPQYFDLGVKIMKRVSTSYTRDDLVGSMGVTKLSKEKVVNDEGLIQHFQNVSKDYEELDVNERKVIFQELMKKVVNAKYTDVVNVAKADFTSRGSKDNPTAFSTRQKLEAMNENKGKGKKMDK